MSDPAKILHRQLCIAADLWEEIRNDPGPADRALANFFYRHRKKLGARDRRLLSEIIYTAFRHLAFLELWAKQFDGDRDALLFMLLAAAAEEIIPLEDFAREITRFGATEQSSRLYSHLKTRRLPAKVAPRSHEEKLALHYSFPLWLVQHWSKVFPAEELPLILEALNQRPPLAIRTNLVKITRQQLIERLNEKGFAVYAAPKSPLGILFETRQAVFKTEEFTQGFFEVQDEGSQLAGLSVDAKPGELIWDVCAGSGGKALLMAGAMHNKGRIIATDIRSRKLEDLKKRASRAGIFNIFPADIHRMDDIKSARGGFDKILVDAPCSGTGTLRRNPDAKWKLTPETLLNHHHDQLAILETALPRLKPGGRLFYVTCSLDPQENEQTIDVFSQKHADLVPLTHGCFKDGIFRLLPHKEGTDGFFVAGFQRQK